MDLELPTSSSLAISSSLSGTFGVQLSNAMNTSDQGLDAFRKFSDMLKESCERYSPPVDDPMRWKSWFQECGFESATEKIFKMPCSPRTRGASQAKNGLETISEGPWHIRSRNHRVTGGVETRSTQADMHAYWHL
ncbi:hypothetical protein MAC_09053 [Metarhizium acridum CQMa 102]|uniref:Uncharacterized protein n=1 Tax=Metarhizium acridum (strain CQMa 102) TaxID=655827 RepID=E9EGQ5_METAQ|nr:uncharacterized protein MAC_09053 [Metarhizium acridum CQMa 102]EFY84911.1 hypothetical protein MAC_09053 [Metarhizium acridum CQMa 102]